MSPPVLPKVFGSLPKTRDRAIDAAILDSLPHLDEATGMAALDLLVQRGHIASQIDLVSTFCEMGNPLRALVVNRAAELHDAIRGAISSKDIGARLAAIELVVAAKDVASSHLLADALREKCIQTRERAGGGLFELTRNYFELAKDESDEGVRYASAYRAHLTACLSDAVSGWDLHHQRPALEAALYLGDAVEPAILKKLDDSNSHLGHMIGEVLEGTSDTRLAGFVLRGLAIDSLRRACVSRITRTTNSQFIDEILRQTWLLTDREIHRGCRWLKDGDWSREWCRAVGDRSSTLPTTAVDFLAHLGGTPEQRMHRFSTLLESPNDRVRLDTLWRVVEDGSKEATILLMNFASRNDESLAELAQRECHRRRVDTFSEGSGAPELATTPTESVRPSPSATTTHGQVLDRYLNEFDRLLVSDRKSLGGKIRSLIGNLPARMTKYARSSDPSVRGRILRVATELGLVGEMAEIIYELAHDTDSGVRGAAVSALRALPGATTVRILRDALNDSEPRVQANAVETLDALGLTNDFDTVSAKLESPNNRVRANTVKALLEMQFEPAADALLEMLEDVSQAHRLSALWVIERMHLRTMLDRIVEMSHSDPDGRVRDRASRVLRSLAVAGTVRRLASVVSSDDVSGVSL